MIDNNASRGFPKFLGHKSDEDDDDHDNDDDEGDDNDDVHGDDLRWW